MAPTLRTRSSTRNSPHPIEPQKHAPLTPKQALNQQETSSSRTTRRTSKRETTTQPEESRPTKRLGIDNLFKKPTNPDPILDHLTETLRRRSICNQFDNLDFHILDQISLEGLYGVTTVRLFHLLDTIMPSLNCMIDERCQDYVWTVIVTRYLKMSSDGGVRLYYLNPREPCKEGETDQDASLIKGLILDKPLRLPSATMKRFANTIDPNLHPVQHMNQVGSCACYQARRDITNEMIEAYEQMGCRGSLVQMNDNYGLENVFYVAGQLARNRAILPHWAEPNVDIKPREYCVLEMIGKSRTLGTVFPKDKTLGRYRLMLLAKGFISQFQETNSSPIVHHLGRYSCGHTCTGSQVISGQVEEGQTSNISVDGPTPANGYDVIDGRSDETTCAKTENTPKQSEAGRVRKDGDQSRPESKRKLTYDQSVPGSNKLNNEDLNDSQKGGKKIEELKQHEWNVALVDGLVVDADGADLGNEVGADGEGEDEDDDDDDDEDLDDFLAGNGGSRNKMQNELEEAANQIERAAVGKTGSLTGACLEPARLRHCQATLMMVYEEIGRSLDEGATQFELRRRLRLPKSHLRNHLKNLISLKMIRSLPPRDPDSTYRLFRTAHKLSPYRWGGGGDGLGFSGRAQIKGAASCLAPIECPTAGVMASWDETDLRAKRIIGHKRSSFSQAEDSLLILCRVSSILLEPQSRLSCCVHKRLVRDLLHRELAESLDKTSDACLRRIKYLKRLPNNLMSIDELTAELRDEPSIHRLLLRYQRLRSKQHQEKQQLAAQLETAQNSAEGSTTKALVVASSAPTGSAKSRTTINRFFVRLLKRVRTKIPDILGITSSPSPTPVGLPETSWLDLRDKWKLVDCQRSLAGRQQIRPQSSSLLQLARKIKEGPKLGVQLSESNEMLPIALLACYNAHSSFQMDLELRIPDEVIANLADSEDLVVQPCNVKFRPSECEGPDMVKLLHDQQWLAKSSPVESGRQQAKQQRNRQKPAHKASKEEQIDERLTPEVLAKLIETLLSWMIAFPGIEEAQLASEFSHLMLEHQLPDLLDLMERFQMVVSKPLIGPKPKRVALFGKTTFDDPADDDNNKDKKQVIRKRTYEPTSEAFLRYCSLLEALDL